MIEIFGPNVSPFVIKVLAAANYKQLPYTHTENVSIRELSKLNPHTGKVPVVLIEGEAIFDSTLILRQFDKIKAEPALQSEDKKVAAKQRMLEDWSDESLYWYNQALRWAPENEERTILQNSRFVPLFARPFAKPLLRHLVGKQPKAQGLGRLPYKVLLAELGGKLEDLELLLGESTFFFSENPSAADFAIYGVFCTGLLDGVTPDFEALMSKHPALLKWHKRVAAVSGHLTSQASGI
ncbi:hypothetical protein SIN8267_01253 [Sinobacterium norvegicum]|uniref:GST N-terminal domain-containing protein n=1 Tax=Sinobacterium norvegicum TaxID=1641715 RepID=A0ABM9AD73_9GAMM|nr:glutathione S-transferase family protein [Sinobacterium norvegicum]CAH0991151.1 hypothetical protein SIN8267_01253 [Sinobacterium norvegicum]